MKGQATAKNIAGTIEPLQSCPRFGPASTVTGHHPGGRGEVPPTTSATSPIGETAASPRSGLERCSALAEMWGLRPDGYQTPAKAQSGNNTEEKRERISQCGRTPTSRRNRRGGCAGWRRRGRNCPRPIPRRAPLLISTNWVSAE